MQEESRVRTIEVSSVLVLCMNGSVSVHTGVHVAIGHVHAHGHGIGIAERHEGEVRQRRNHPSKQDACQEGQSCYVLASVHASRN